MKSYFAKLAARATLANAPASPRTSSASLSDPFEESATQPIVSDVTGTAHHPLHRSPQPPAARVITESQTEVSKPAKPRADERELRTNETRQTPTPPDTVVTKSIAPRPSDVPPAFEPPETRKRSQDDSPAQARFEVDTTQPALQPAKSTSDAVLIGPKEKETRPSASETNERLDEVEKGQATLLQKADAFMAELTVRRRAPPPREEPETHEERQIESVKLNRSHEAPVRLEPVARPARLPEPVDNEPSVVIGNLSVEILPSPPPPSPPQQVVVRRSGGVRPRSGAPSSQRFGFTRF